VALALLAREIEQWREEVGAPSLLWVKAVEGSGRRSCRSEQWRAAVGAAPPRISGDQEEQPGVFYIRQFRLKRKHQEWN
jgi:hypothetical protein